MHTRAKEVLMLVLMGSVLFFSGTGHAGFSVVPTEDREINHLYYGAFDTFLLADGQWWPAVRFVSSPEEEQRLVMKYDLSGLSGALFSRATLRTYVWVAWNFNNISLDAWFYEDDSTIGSDDFDLGTELVGAYLWSAPVANVEMNTIEQYAEFDVTDVINHRGGDAVFFNLRLAGGYPDFTPNVFGSTGADHSVILGAVENSAFSPSLELTPECIADADGDHDLDGTDLRMLMAEFGAACSQASPCSCDFNSDNVVDGKDLSDLAADFGRATCPGVSGYAIRGQVFGINIKNPGPLRGVKVSAGDRQTTTDANGHFEITGLPEDHFTLRVDGWNYTHGPYGQVHFDIVIPQGETAIDHYTVRLPYIGPANKIVIDASMADLSTLSDGSKTALLKGNLTIATESDGGPVSLLLKQGTMLTFPPGVEPELAVIHLGLNGMPVPLPMDSGSGDPLYTLNTFTIQPEGVSFSQSPELVFGDHDRLPTGTSYLVYHYGSWEDQTPSAPPAKQADGTITVASGMTSSGTFAMPPNPLEFAPSDWKMTTLTGRVVVKSEDGTTLIPVEGAEVSGGINGGTTGADGRFSFQVLSQLPDDTHGLAVMAHAFKVLEDGILYTGMNTLESSDPEGVTDIGDIVLNTIMWLSEIRPKPFDANVDPVQLVSADPAMGIKFRFDRPLAQTNPQVFNIVRLPMLHSLYAQKMIGIPESWGEFDPDLCDCTQDDMTVSFSCEPPGCNEPVIDEVCLSECHADCEDSLNDCLSDCEPDCAAYCEDYADPEECYADCITCVPKCNDDHALCYMDCSACTSDCVECPEDEVNTVVFNLSGCDYAENELYNEWWWFILTEMESGLRGANNEVLFDPDLTTDVYTGAFGGEISALFNYMGSPPILSLWFATKEDSGAKPAPLLGLLIPDDEDPSGFEWHDYDTLDASVTLEVEPGAVLRIQAEDQTFMKRITASLGNSTFIKTASDETEQGYLMHLEIPFPENAGPEPVLLTVTAEGNAHGFLKTVNNMEGHKTGFEVYLSPVNNGPVIDQVSPSQGLFVGDTVSFQVTGSRFIDVVSAAVIDPSEAPTAVGFTIQNDTHITLSDYTFAGPGAHRIRLTSPSGQDEKTVMVESPSGEALWAMKAAGTNNYWDSSINLSDHRETPPPYQGLNQVSVSTSIETVGSGQVNASFSTGAGETQRTATVNILHIEDAIQGHTLQTSGTLAGANKVYCREVITTYGAELADGSTLTEGTIPCHLEISGTTNRNEWGPNGWVYYRYRLGVGVLDGLGSISDDPYTFISEAPDPIGWVQTVGWSAADCVSDPSECWPAGTTPLNAVSTSFDLPVSSQIAFYPTDYDSRLEWRATNMTDNLASVTLDIRLVCDEPGVKLIYRK